MHIRFKIIAFIIAATLAACGAPQSDSPENPDASTYAPTNPEPTREAAPAPSPTSSTVVEQYVVRYGDTLSSIAQRYDLSIDELMKLNGLANPDALQVGQVLKVTVVVTRSAPAERLIPDSEVVYSPAYAFFDVTSFANQYNGYLAAYRERVEGELLSGPQIIQLVAERYSVGPRVLLALVELQSGWVTKSLLTQSQITYPMGLIDSTRQGLFRQISWAADRLNEGYYGRLSGKVTALKFRDRSRARTAPSINPGSAAIQNALASVSTWDAWQNQIGPNGFSAIYKSLFGNADAYAIDPLVPRDLKQPPLRLPWSDGALWYFTGGAHSAWGESAAWAAVDFTPRDVAGSCWTSGEWVIAAAPGRIIRTEHGRVMQSLSNNNFQGTGWTLLYMHIAGAGRVSAGAQMNAGDRIGRPSCEGGTANASHVHFARLYNGQWIAADNVPFVLSGWKAIPADQEYEGKMTRGSETREACSCRDDLKSGIIADAGPATNH